MKMHSYEFQSQAYVKRMETLVAKYLGTDYSRERASLHGEMCGVLWGAGMIVKAGLPNPLYDQLNEMLEAAMAAKHEQRDQSSKLV